MNLPKRLFIKNTKGTKYKAIFSAFCKHPRFIWDILSWKSPNNVLILANWQGFMTRDKDRQMQRYFHLISSDDEFI